MMLANNDADLPKLQTNALTPEDRLIINDYFLDSLKYIVQTYQNEKNKLKIALNYIIDKNADIAKISPVDLIFTPDIGKHPEKYFQNKGIWKHMQRIQAILEHPNPAYILNTNKALLDLQQPIKAYVADQIQAELTKLKEAETSKSQLQYYFDVYDFKEAVKKQRTLPKNAYLRVAPGYTNESVHQDVTWVAEQIENGNCPEGLKIEFLKTVDDESFKRLARTFTSKNCPKNLHLIFVKCSMSSASAYTLSDVLKTGLCKEGLSINLSERGLGYSRGIGSYGANALAEALASGKCPKNFALNIRDNDIARSGQLAFMHVIAQGQSPLDCAIEFLSVQNDEELDIYTLIQTALTNGSFPAKVPLTFYLGEKTLPGLKAVISGLQSGNSPSGLEVRIRAVDINRFENGQLVSTVDALGDNLAIQVAKGMIAGKFPANLTLDIAYNKIGPKGAEALAKALMHPNCPEGFTLSLSHEIGIEGAEVIKQALASGQCPPGLKIVFNCVTSSEYGDIKKILNEGEKAYARIAAERIMILHQGKREVNAHSSFFLIPTGVINKIAEQVEPYQSKENLDLLTNSMHTKFDKQILPLPTQLWKLNLLPATLRDKMKVADRLSLIGKMQLEFTPDIKFNEIQSIVKKLQAAGLECQAFKGSQKASHLKINIDLEDAKTLLPIPGDLKDQISIHSKDCQQGNITVQFSDHVSWKDVQGYAAMINGSGFTCVAHQGFSSPSYIKMDIEKLGLWLHQQCLPTKHESKWCEFFPSLLSPFKHQPTAGQQQIDQAAAQHKCSH